MAPVFPFGINQLVVDGEVGPILLVRAVDLDRKTVEVPGINLGQDLGAQLPTSLRGLPKHLLRNFDGPTFPTRRQLYLSSYAKPQQAIFFFCLFSEELFSVSGFRFYYAQPVTPVFLFPLFILVLGVSRGTRSTGN